MTREEYLDAIHAIAGHFGIGDLISHAGIAYSSMENVIMRMANSHSDFSARYTGGFLSRVADCCYALTGHDHRIGGIS